jgi:hypothetical protein
MTPRNLALLDALEPLGLAAYPAGIAVRAFTRRVEEAPDDEHDTREILQTIQWYAECGLKNERVAFALVAETLAELVREVAV